MTLNCCSSTCAYLIAEQQFRVNKALLYVDAVYNYYLDISYDSVELNPLIPRLGTA
jgi:hypothetical protein